MDRSTATPVSSGIARCIVCGGNDGRVICTKGSYQVRLCSCEGAYLSPIPEPNSVDPTIDPHPASFYALPAKQKVAWLAKRMPACRLLEVGPGDGHFLRAARSQGYEVSGVEPHSVRAATLTAESGISIESSTLEDCAVPDGCVDVVYHCDLLSHFPDPVGALQRMGRMLAPGGVLFFEVGLHGNIAPFWYRRMPEQSVPRHRWFFGPRALQQLLHTAGFRIDGMKRFGLAHQVLFYQTMGPMVRGLRGIKRRMARSHGAVATPPAVSSSRLQQSVSESHLEAWVNNFLRFGLGSWMPRIGPQTSFVLARRLEDS